MIDWEGMKENDPRPAKGLWASGNYTNRCHDCGCWFMGDKRARQCADCAYTEAEKMIENIENMVKLNTEEGDMLIVTLPENKLPKSKLEEYSSMIADKFNLLLKDKKVKVIVVPFGLKVEIIKSSIFETKVQ